MHVEGGIHFRGIFPKIWIHGIIKKDVHFAGGYYNLGFNLFTSFYFGVCDVTQNEAS